MSYVDALQTTLAAEHAAVFVLAYLGAQTSDSQQPTLAATLDTAYAVHRARRDLLVTRVSAAGATPVASAAAYHLPDLAGPDAVEPAALALERRCAATYDFLVASSPSDQRRFAVGLLLDSALRALTLGGEPETFPGR